MNEKLKARVYQILEDSKKNDVVDPSDIDAVQRILLDSSTTLESVKKQVNKNLKPIASDVIKKIDEPSFFDEVFDTAKSAMTKIADQVKTGIDEFLVPPKPTVSAPVIPTIPSPSLSARKPIPAKPKEDQKKNEDKENYTRLLSQHSLALEMEQRVQRKINATQEMAGRVINELRTQMDIEIAKKEQELPFWVNRGHLKAGLSADDVATKWWDRFPLTAWLFTDSRKIRTEKVESYYAAVSAKEKILGDNVESKDADVFGEKIRTMTQTRLRYAEDKRLLDEQKMTLNSDLDMLSQSISVIQNKPGFVASGTKNDIGALEIILNRAP